MSWPPRKAQAQRSREADPIVGTGRLPHSLRGELSSSELARACRRSRAYTIHFRGQIRVLESRDIAGRRVCGEGVTILSSRASRGRSSNDIRYLQLTDDRMGGRMQVLSIIGDGIFIVTTR